MFGKESFARVKVTEAMKQNLANAANNAITKGTWASYKPVIRHLERCQEELGVKFSEPAEAEDVLAFISYMADSGQGTPGRHDQQDVVGMEDVDDGPGEATREPPTNGSDTDPEGVPA